MADIAPGWYPDPQDATRLRYWDGMAWTEQTTPANAAPAAPAAAAAAAPAVPHILSSTTFDIAGMVIEQHLGLVWGLVVRSVGFAKGFTGGLRSLAEGEVPEYTELVDRTRHHAMSRLFEHVAAVGGNAVVGVRFDATEVGSNLTEIVAYGTAVVARPAS